MGWGHNTIPAMRICALQLLQPPKLQQHFDPALTRRILQRLQKCHSSELTFTEEFATYLHPSLPTHIEKQPREQICSS